MEKSRKHKIAFIHPDLGIGGAERLVLDVAVALTKEGNEVVFITNHFDRTHAFEELRDNKFPVRVVGDWIPRSVCGIFQALCAYIRMMYLSLVYVLFLQKEDKPDVFFIDQIPMAVPFIKWASGKVVYYCHHPDLLASPSGGTLKKLYRAPINWLELKGTAMADVLLVNSKYTASVFRKTFPEITKDIHILYPTISSSYQTTVSKNTQVKPVHELVPEVPALKDGIIFLSINRYHPAKKLELVLNGLEALKSKVSSNDWNRVHLIIAGGYDPLSSINATYFFKLVELCHAKNLTTKVTFLKSPSDNLKADLLLACDCLIYTPVNEHFGIVPLEAMTAGKPVIACNSGGPCETVQHEVTGYLCDPTPDSLADAMSKMLNKTTSHKMGILGKDRLEKCFSHATFTACVNDVINNLLNIKEHVNASITTALPEKPQCNIPSIEVTTKQENPENINTEEPFAKENDNMYLTESNLNSSVSSTGETCFLSPRNSSRANSELDVSDASDTGIQSVEVVDEALHSL